MILKRILPALLLSVLVFTSCKNKLNIQAPYKDITVVYGLLDQNDPIHYVRVNKAFEGLGDAYTMAKQYDSIYYPVGTISVVIEDSNPTTGNIQNVYTLDTTTSIPLSPGTFSYPKQLLYYTTASLNNPNDYYNLVVKNTKTGKQLRGSTMLLQDVYFTSPGDMSSHTIALNLANNPVPTPFQWSSSATGRIYQITLLFYYDIQINGSGRIPQTPLELVLPPQTAATLGGGITMIEDIAAQQLYSLIVGSLKPVSGITRNADSLGIIFTSGTDDLNTYIQLSQPPTGINQDIPSFSDVSNGVGLFTARHVQTYHKPIGTPILDSLSQEQRFINLGF